MIFDGHSDIFTDVTVRRLKGETQVLKNHHLPRLRKGNIEGGLTTIEEKALGNIQKIGTKAPVIGTLDKAVTPTGPGLWFMDSSSAAAEMITLVAAAGYVVHFFPTGQGNIIGNPIVPVIKLSANPRTIRTMSEHMDVDVSGILRREMNLDQAGDKLLDMM